MTEVKRNLIRDATIIFDRLPPQKQERAIGIMQGMMLVASETEQNSEKQTAPKSN